MRKTVSLVLALALLAWCCVPLSAAAAPFAQKVNVYTPGQFADVPADSWCEDGVRTAYEYGVMGGKKEDFFDAAGNVTRAQTLVMACRLHGLYCGPIVLPEEAADPWYQPYVDYAGEHEFLDFADGLTETWFNGAVSRADFAGMLWAAMPEEMLEAVNTVEDGAIPDMPLDDYCADGVYSLYRAGVLTGNDGKGTFTPDSSITRGAAAAIVGRLADPSLRKRFTLRAPDFAPVPMAQLANLKSLRKNAGDAELAQAYQAALAVVTPLAKMSRADQLTGIAVALRQMFESGMTYSSSGPHYNDPYGYFVLKTASCAGCTRATGLCLNILGIPYEHVNENQWSHQWCRVKVGEEYWICDAYGLYCGPEPAPYVHPYL